MIRNIDQTISEIVTKEDYKTILASSDDLKPFDETSKKIFETISKLSKEKPEGYFKTIKCVTDLYGEYAYTYKQLKNLETAMSLVSEKGVCNWEDSADYNTEKVER